MPIGRTPGHLSRGINLHATKALRCSGLTTAVHRRLATLARAEQRLLDALYEQQSFLHAKASKPERPAAPFILRAALRMASLFRFSNMIGFTGVGVPCNKLLGEAGFPDGCFSIRTSRVVRGAIESGITSSRLRTPPEGEDDNNLRALFTFSL